MENNETASICSACKGDCCKTQAGMVFPEDLGEVTLEKLQHYIDNGYQFDYWEGNPTGKPEHAKLTAYMLRPQHTNSVNKIVDASWGGTCVFLTDTGCSKSWKERPSMCKALIANKTFDCASADDKYSKQNAAIAWLPYNDLILKIINK
jgi:Fe-S-cluster containining protein